MIKKINSVLFLLALFVAVVLCGCAPNQTFVPSTPPSSTQEIKPMVIGVPEISGNFDPFFSKTLYDTYVQNLMFDYLVSVDEKGNIIDSIAKHTVSDDGLTYTFTIVDNALYSDGTPVKSYDFEFAIMVYADPTYDGYYDFSMLNIEGYSDYQSGNSEKISGISTPDDKTLVVRLTTSSPTTLSYFTIPAMKKEYYGEEYAKGDLSDVREKLKKPIGSGQYKFVSLVPGHSLTLEANDSYFLGSPNIKHVVFSTTPSGMEITRLSLKETDLDFVQPDISNIEELKKYDFLESYSYPFNGISYLVINNTIEKFSNKNVRQALYYALDRTSLLKNIYGDNAWTIDAPISSRSPYFNGEGLNAYEYNLNKSAQLLEGEGYKKNANGIYEKDGVELSLLLSIDPTNPVGQGVASLFASSLSTLGVKFATENLDFASVFDRLSDGTLEMFMLGSALTSEPNPFDLFHSQGYQNFSFYASEEADALMAKAMSEVDPSQKQQYLNQIFKIINDDAPVIFLYQRNDLWVSNKRIKGLEFSPYTNFSFNLYKAYVE